MSTLAFVYLLAYRPGYENTGTGAGDYGSRIGHGHGIATEHACMMEKCFSMSLDDLFIFQSDLHCNVQRKSILIVGGSLGRSDTKRSSLRLARPKYLTQDGDLFSLLPPLFSLPHRPRCLALMTTFDHIQVPQSSSHLSLTPAQPLPGLCTVPSFPFLRSLAMSAFSRQQRVPKSSDIVTRFPSLLHATAVTSLLCPFVKGVPW